MQKDLIDEHIVERVAFDIGLGKNYEGYSQREFIRERKPSFYEIEPDTHEEDYNQKLKDKLKREIIEDILGLKK